ncbi:metallophosphoesterase [Slackia heliotrinireducens]|uniref:metallophosphoesterase n=1 Tax=Slackia heliotrinireducens TaxID=84110 RepID=UPI003315F9FD
MRRYAMSDIHGCIEPLQTRIAQVEELGFFDTDCADELVLLGDYVDRGPDSLGVLRAVMALEQRAAGRVIVLRGNHDEMFLEWLGVPTTGGVATGLEAAGFDEDLSFGFDDDLGFDEFGSSDFYDVEPPFDAPDPDRNVMDPEYRFRSFRQMDPNLATMRSFLTDEQLRQLDHGMRRFATMIDAFDTACHAIRNAYPEVISWMQNLRDYHETERQIFVHAGIDESAGREWALGTPRETMLGTRTTSNAPFYKDVICGHTPTCYVCGNPDHHDVLRWGPSHIYIDGMTTASGVLPLLVWNSETGEYASL